MDEGKKAAMLERYSRQMLLPGFGLSGQEILQGKKVLVVGAGGIGSTVCMYLAAAGVVVHVMDHDVVEISNLHRQIIHCESKIGTNKAISAVDSMSRINSAVSYDNICSQLSHENALQIIPHYDLVIDATDNFKARYIINDACVLSKVPFISGSSVGLEGQVRLIIPYLSPCYRCLNPKPSVNESCRSCANAGVLGPVAGLIGCLQAIEAIKYLQSDLAKALKSDLNSTETLPSQSKTSWETLHNRQTFYDGASGTFYNFNLPARSSKCLICSDHEAVIHNMMDSERLLSAALEESNAVTSAYIPLLAANHSVPVTVFSEESKTKPYFIIDVRSKVQFEMSSFSGYFPELDTRTDILELNSAIRIDRSRNYLFHIPLDDLKGGKEDRLKEENRQKVITILSDLAKSDEKGEDGNEIGHRDFFVICRRGVDSVVATHYLLENGFGPNVYNVQGGYTAWKNEVDKSFPMY